MKILDIGLGRELLGDDVPEGKIETQLTRKAPYSARPIISPPNRRRTPVLPTFVPTSIASAACCPLHRGATAVPRSEHHDANAQARDRNAASAECICNRSAE